MSQHIEILVGDVRERLAELSAESVQCCVTSPPYWGLRDYGVAGQIGIESSLDEYIQRLVEVFREVRRVLRDDGTLWLNLGDAYCGCGGAGGVLAATGLRSTRDSNEQRPEASNPELFARWRKDYGPSIKPKDLLGLPWMVAFALRADGWYLRQDVIWHKPNPMPESVRDRCTKAHEYIFLLSKSQRYYYDAQAIAEPASALTEHDLGGGYRSIPGQTPHGSRRSGNKARKPASARGVPVDDGGSTRGAVACSVPWEGTRRNKRSVWAIKQEPFPEAHFATFPTALARLCILAGTRRCDTVLDPFAGSGTTLVAAIELGRQAVGIELNPMYCDMIRRRLAHTTIGLGIEAAE